MVRKSLFALMLAAPLSLIAGARAAAPAAEAPAEPAKVMVVGLVHLANPGRDLFNVQVDDVLSDRRQAEIARIVEGLARFGPDRVMVEMPAALADERYAAYRAGSLPPSRSESVQLGFRLAALRGLERVHGIDVGGDFPFAEVQAFAERHGRGAKLQAMLDGIGEEIQGMNRRLAEGSLGSLLRYMNQPERILRLHGSYIDYLRFGEGEEQPGAVLASAWYARNLQICARLLQALEPGSRAVVIYGEGHAHLLRQCVYEAPGVELVEAADYLPE